MIKQTLLLSLATLLPLGAAAQYTIYPVPQDQVAGAGKVAFTQSVTLVCENGIDTYTVNRAKQVLTEAGLTVTEAATPSVAGSNVFVGIYGSKGAADKKLAELGLATDVFAKAGKFDRHVLSLTDAGSGTAQLVVVGENTNGAFYGFASLEQMFDGGTAGMSAVTLYDYADRQNRGIVEGYYGYPYSVAVKKDLMRFMMRYKMNTYMYGAKSDPYHSQYWADPYPTSLTAEQEKNGWLSQSMVTELADVSHQTKVNFIWAIHPGNNFVSGGAATINQIMGKFEKMYNLGVRQFAVFVDDVSVPSSDADMKTNAAQLTNLQKAIEKKWNENYTQAVDTVRPLHFVPQIYCRSFAGSQDQHDRFFQALKSTPSYITIYTTGGGVWSTPNDGDYATPANQLGREVAWWWNYPCNDNADGQIYPSDMYYNFFEMPSVNNNATLPATLNRGLGIVCNPMQQGEVSKTPLFSAADYAWNTDGFNNKTSWEASFKAVLPGNETAQAAYKFLVPYLRWNNPDELTAMFNAYKTSKDGTALRALMGEIKDRCEVLVKMKDSSVEAERLLYNDLAPWLLRLQAMATGTDSYLAIAADNSGDDKVWADYVATTAEVNQLDTKEDYLAYALEGMGTGISVSVRPSQPSQKSFPAFVNYMKGKALDGYIKQEPAPTKAQGITNIEGVTITTSGTTTVSPMTGGKFVTMKKGEWIGLQLAEPTKVEKIVVADTLISKHSVVMSADGKLWTPVTQTTTEPDGYVRYVGVVNEHETPVQIRLTSTSVKVTMPAATKVSEATIPEADIWENHTAGLMYDGDYSTFTCIYRNQQNGDAYQLKLNKSQPIERVRIVMGTVNGDHMTAGRVQISADGTKWTNLKVKGTNSVNYTMDIPQVQNYSDEAKYCDFDGEGQEARYVRLYLSTANTSKWLRLYEIEVNGAGAFTRQRCVDAQGNGYSQLSDADASTSTADVHAGDELTYYFQNYSLLDGVTLYTDPASMAHTKIAYSRNLENWTDMDYNPGQGVIRLAFPAEAKDVAAMRFTWTGDKAPAIYELVENANETERPVVSEIEQITGPQTGTAPAVSVQGHTLHVSAAALAAVSVYTADGRLVANRKINGASAASLPLFGAAGSTYVVKVVLSNGSAYGYKIK